jgi:glutathionylspermidine synthase
MHREDIIQRNNWQQKMEAIGFDFHSIDGRYWEESACYCFSVEEIDMIEEVTAELHQMCLEAIQHIIINKRYDDLAIPELFRKHIEQSWLKQEPSVYGRFDFSYDGFNAPKLLEYNADTPTSLIEASIAQWFWLEEVKPEMDQFNSIHEKLIDRWKKILSQGWIREPLYFSCVDECQEDYSTVQYLRDTAYQAGILTSNIFIEDIGWDAFGKMFVDLEEKPIYSIFKLYPWEWMIQEEFGQYILSNKLHIIEPCWKMLLSNKGILPILWELYPNHPNLLPAYFNSFPLNMPHVKKPLLSREGSNISIYTSENTLTTEGLYGSEGYVYQAYAPLPKFGDNNYPVIGAWIIGNEVAGLGIREDNSLITKNTSRFIPHYFVPKD